MQTAQPSRTTAWQSDAPKALLVGASRGLGLGLATLFAARGWDLVATERGASAGLEAAANAAAQRFRVERLDITNHDEIEGPVRDVVRNGAHPHVHVLEPALLAPPV